MEAAIEETLFGASEAISPIILSMKHLVPIEDARSALDSFYRAHADKLSAVYCLSGRRDGRRIITVVLAQEVEAEISNITDATCVLYAVAPANANDEVVLSGLALQRSQLALALSNEQLAKTGRVLNPLYSSERPKTAIFESQPKPAPQALSPEPTTAATVKPVIPVGNSSSKISNVIPSTDVIRGVHSVSETKPKPKTATTTDSNRSKEPAKPAGISSFFSKGTRNDVLKAKKCDLPLKAASTVVIADDIQDDEIEVEAPSNKKEQYEKLRGIFDKDEPRQMEPEPSQEEQDIDVAMSVEVDPPTEMGDAEDNLPDQGEDQMIVDDEVIEDEPMKEHVQIQDVPLEKSLAGHSPETNPENPVQEDHSADIQGQKEAYVKQAELDDGWSLTEFVPAAQPAKKEPAKPKPKQTPKPAISLPKIPAKPGKKQQSTLTSFFGKK